MKRIFIQIKWKTRKNGKIFGKNILQGRGRWDKVFMFIIVAI